MATAVLDASALLAFMRGEDGSDVVEAALGDGCAISVVNHAEVMSKLGDAGQDPELAAAELGQLGTALELEPMTEADSIEVGLLRAVTRDLGLSLGDRCCLALARRLGLPALTADRAWREVDAGIETVVIR